MRQLMSLLLLSVLLAGCDKCGDWFRMQSPGSIDACKGDTRRQ